MKLSIITINLNNKEGLQQTIDSVINQTFTDYEFLIIDGGSKDGSVDTIKQHEAKISHWISEPDKGIYNAMNKGIKIAKGEYLYFLNTGDRLASNDVLAQIFENDPHESFICGNYIKEKGDVYTKDDSYKYRGWDQPLYDLYADNLCHQAFFIKADNFDKYGLYDETLRITADWKLFFIAIAINRESVIYKDVDIVIYNLEGLSATIGGKVIGEEKMSVFKQYLSQNTIARFNQLGGLENDSYIIKIVHSRKWIYYAFHAFRRIGKSMGFIKKDL